MKILSVITIIAVLIALITTTLYVRTSNELKQVQAWKDQDPFIKEEIELVRSQREVHRLRAELAMATADSLGKIIAKLQKKSNLTKIEYVEDLNAWRALPPTDRDVRVNFFTKELSTVDTIAQW